jgi:class I fructose-bisphosphate aldolase
MIGRIQEILGNEAQGLLSYQAKVPKDSLHLPGPDFIDRMFVGSDRPTRTLTSLGQLFNAGRLAGTGYVSILPVDQGIEHSAGASFAPNPAYFDPENIVKKGDAMPLPVRWAYWALLPASMRTKYRF